MSKVKYIKKVTKAGETIEVEKTQSARYGRSIPRGGNKGKTPPDVREVNRRNAIKNLTRIINANFGPGDLHVILTYDDNHLPDDPQEAKKSLEKFERDMRRFYTERDRKFDYIAVTEYKSARIHHHLVIKAIDLKTVMQFWPHGLIRSSVLDMKKEYSALAAYLVKETDRTFRGAQQYL